jgi:hypothetical protein
LWFTLLGDSFVFLDVGPSISFLVFPLFWVLWFIFDWQGFIKHDPFKFFTDMQGFTLLPHHVDTSNLPELVVRLTLKELLMKQDPLQ